MKDDSREKSDVQTRRNDHNGDRVAENQNS